MPKIRERNYNTHLENIHSEGNFSGNGSVCERSMEYIHHLEV